MVDASLVVAFDAESRTNESISLELHRGFVGLRTGIPNTSSVPSRSCLQFLREVLQSLLRGFRRLEEESSISHQSSVHPWRVDPVCAACSVTHHLI